VGLFGSIDPRRAVPSGMNRSIAAIDNSVIAALTPCVFPLFDLNVQY